ncbi:MAG: class I SAM-dependent methyltransferase [Ardenticatenaceae bacterium]
MTAIADWKKRVEAHHEQSIRAQGETWSSGDFWRPFAENFRDDPRRTDDVMLNRLLQEVDSSSTVLDVGAGGGRFALPLALKCKGVTAVEPSGAMIEQMRAGMEESGINNISIVQQTWEEANVEPADVTLCAHVVYGVVDIELFLRKLTSHARRRVLLPAFTHPPIARFSPFWKPVHGEGRIEMPALKDIVEALWDMDIYPNVEMVERIEQRPFRDWDSALNQLRLRLYVMPDTEQDARLQKAMETMLEETPDGFAINGLGPRHLGLISWVAG